MEEQNDDQAQVSIEDLSGAKKVLTIEIPEKVVKREYDKAYRELKKNARVKGFRPGKVPRSVLERMYGKEVNENMKQQMVGEAFEKAMLDHKLDVIGEPQLDAPEIKKGEPFTFKLTVDVKQKVENIDFKGLDLKRNKYIISDQMVDKQLEQHRQNMPETEPINEDRPLQLNDIAVIEYEGFKEGKPFEMLPKTTAVRMEIGKNELFPNFDENLLGMNQSQERSFEFSFPELYSNESLGGQKVEMKVLLKEIRKKVLPEINDDFAKKLGGYQSVDELRQAIQQNFEQLYNQQAEKELQEMIFTQLLERASFDVPEAWVEQELVSIKQEIQQSLASQNVDMEKVGFTDENIVKQYRTTAENQARRRLLLNYLIDQEKMVATDNDVEAEFERIASSTGKAVDTVKDYYQQEEHRQNLDTLKYTILERKAMQMIQDANTIETVSLEADTVSDSKQ
ncbi:MAG: Trigger factor [Candidatus Magnetoglobus multicellularis str. Araruama]|uniref:Trigger factor n=1 Tax=Candidatus Magnetoglobus multicellularis str. Araruama TaxID=890399 RepID=A0A1V1PFG6_9BACT|nr:MAG: Trigger factor [Candidatus Magnetoglobus multicellularis str. Araruama]